MIGTTIGPYQVVAKLGEGGMGEVYRARDTKLNRDVAIKVLPEMFAADADRLARFTREAQVLASLNHPNIAQVYGIEGDGSPSDHRETRPLAASDHRETRPLAASDHRETRPLVRFPLALVMELVEGEDLSTIIARGPIAVSDALPVAKQIADALEAAHEQGIVHRDLKPANIKVRADGTVKVLDFGLAKAMDPHGAEAPGLRRDDANSPTLTARGTQMGMILGTAAYMAPEQARGRAVDRRADIWAFGVVLYEMLAGRRAFDGDDISITLASVLKEDVAWNALPADLPASLRRLLSRCLDKDPKRRLSWIGEARLTLDDPASSVPEAERPERTTGGRERLAWAAAGVMALVAVVAFVVPRSGRATGDGVAPPEVRFTIEESLAGGELSPDGRFLAYQTLVGGRRRMLIRTLASGVALPIASADESIHTSTGVFWSADSRSVAYFSNQKLKTIALATGAVATVADAPTPRGGAWGPDGTIVFAPGGNSALFRVPPSGGAPEAVTVLRDPQVSHRNPVFLPDGRHFLLLVLGPRDVRGVYLGSLDSPDIARLLDADGAAAFAEPNHVLFVREGVLYSQHLDLTGRRMIGDPEAVTSGVSANMTSPRAVSTSRTGMVSFIATIDDERQLLWVDRSGKTIEKVGEPLTNTTWGDLSPDGRTLAIARDTHGRSDVSLMEMGSGRITRFASDASRPIWSHDSSRLAFSSGQDGLMQVYLQQVGASGPPELLFRSPEAQNSDDWSLDGRHVLFSSQSPTNARDLWAIPVNGSARTPLAVAQTGAEERNGAFSSDGLWVAYQSDETGTNEVYVRPFPGPGRSWPVSTKGSNAAPHVWGRDNKVLYYAVAGHVMAVPITLTAERVDAGTPIPLFPLSGYLIASPDGKRFLVTTRAEGAPAVDPARGGIPRAPLTVIVNWAGRGR